VRGASTPLVALRRLVALGAPFSRSVGEAAEEHHSDPTSSCDKTCAFFARSRARAQSPAWPASRASEIKLRTLEARSACVASNDFPAVAARLRSALLKFLSVSCCREADSSVDNPGTICGTAGFAGGTLWIVEGATLCGRAGAILAASGAGRGGISNRRSGMGSSTSMVAVARCGKIGRTSTAVLHGMAGFVRAAQPLMKIATDPSTLKKIRAQSRITASWGSAEVSVICIRGQFPLRLSHQAASGNSMRNVVPLPTSVVKSIEPLRSCTIRNVLASPIPLPPGRVVKKSWKIF
jgi:hypothetical protein